MDIIIGYYLFQQEWSERLYDFKTTNLRLVRKAYYKKKISKQFYYNSLSFFGIYKDLKDVNVQKCFEFACQGGRLSLMKQMSECDLTIDVIQYAFKYKDIVLWLLKDTRLQKQRMFHAIQHSFDNLCRFGYIEIFKILKKFIIEQIDYENLKVSSGLYFAYRNKHNDVVEWLITTFNIGKNKIHVSGIRKFLTSGDPKDITWLISKFGKEYISNVDKFLNYSLYICCTNGYLESAKLIYKEFKISPNTIYNSFSNGSFVSSAVNGHKNVVDWLISIQGTKAITHNNYKVISKCLSGKNEQMAKYLINLL